MILFIKMIKDLKENVTQFLAILIMSFFALFVVSGLGVLSLENVERYFTEANYKDIDIQGDLFTEDTVSRIRLLEGVKCVDAWYNTSGTIELDKEYKMVLSFVTDNNISKINVSKGEPYSSYDGGIWIEERFADSKGIDVGDYITIKSENAYITEKVRGLVANPEYITYIGDPEMEEADYTKFGFGILNISECVNSSGRYNKLLVDVKGIDSPISLSKEEEAILNDIKLRLYDLLDNKNVIITQKDKDEAFLSYKERVGAYDAIKYVFAMVFGLIAMIGILSTMSRLIARQRTTIGALKALGFSSRTIMLHYLSYSVVVVLLGCISGSVAGYFFLGDVVYSGLVKYYINPYETKVFSSGILIFIFLLLLLTVVVSFFCNQKILMLSASQILQPSAPKASKQSWYESTFIWRKLKFSTQWNIRDVSRNVLRSIISLFGVMVCSVLIFMATGFLETLSDVPYWLYDRLITSENRITLSAGVDYLTAFDVASEFKGQMVSDNSIEVMIDNRNISCTMYVVGKGNYYHLNDTEGKYMDIPENGVTISLKISNATGLLPGNLITWSLKGSEKTYTERIAAINKNPMQQGITVSADYYENKMNGEFIPTYVYTNCSVLKSVTDRQEIDSVISCDEIKNSLANILAASYSVVVIMILAAVILGMVIMYNMGVMAYNEKIKDMATLKVLGFYSKDLKAIILQQNIALSFVGMLIGIPYGYKGIIQLTDMWGEKTDFIINPSAMPYIATFTGVFVIALIVNNMIVKRIDTINMVEALKGM